MTCRSEIKVGTSNYSHLGYRPISSLTFSLTFSAISSGFVLSSTVPNTFLLDLSNPKIFRCTKEIDYKTIPMSTKPVSFVSFPCWSGFLRIISWTHSSTTGLSSEEPRGGSRSFILEPIWVPFSLIHENDLYNTAGEINNSHFEKYEWK